MLKLTLTAATLLLSAAPAMADWGPTHWGMSAEEVIAAVPGAKATAAEKGTNVNGLQQLAVAPWKDGDVATTATFLFDPDNGKLVFVGLMPDDPGQCEAYRATMVARYGKGKPTDRVFGEMAMGKLDWIDPQSHDQLMFSFIRKTSDQSYSICKFIAQQPAK